MAKPASLPRWADVGGDIVEPSSGKKDIGWIVSEQPPHSYFNWFQNLVYQWCDYLDGLTGEALTWTAAHVFQSTVNMTNGTAADTLTVAATGSSARFAIRGTGSATEGAFVGTSARNGGAIVGTNTGTGGSAAGVTGGGASVGVDGVALGGVVGASGVRGQALDADGAAGRFSHSSASGVSVISTASGANGIAVKAVASGSGTVAVRAEGHSAGAGSPVLAVAGHASQSAVEGDGTSHNGNGVYGHTDGAVGVKGVNSGELGQAANFANTSVTNLGTVLVVTQHGHGAGLLCEASEGLAGSFANTSSTNPALNVQSSGSTPAIRANGAGTSVGLNLVPQAAPSVLTNGDIWVETGTNTLKVRINGVTKTVTLT